MIRPITIVTFLMASGSGLYLYQSKHEVQLLDRQIEKGVHDTSAVREQSRLLAAEWTMLGQPDRLQAFADEYLSLKPINPAQFTSLADLNGRLPAVETPKPAEPAAEGQPVASNQTDMDEQNDADEAPPQERPEAPAAKPVPVAQQPAAKPVESRKIIAARSAEPKPAPVRLAEPPRVAEARPARPAGAAPLQAMAAHVQTVAARPPAPVAHAAPPIQAAAVPVRQAPPIQTVSVTQFRPVSVQPRQMPYQPTPIPASAPAMGGSLLGMAHSASPVPRPMPAAAQNWYAN